MDPRRWVSWHSTTLEREANFPKSFTVGGLLASLKSAPEQWAERTAAGRIKVVHVKRWDEVMGWEMRNGGRKDVKASSDSD
jgi:hypothetical protein